MIRVLEKNIADKIAAGEVVERPISIVKELVENALDAGATSIICEIKNGGKTYIRITDNGCGIPEDEVETAFLRHATSKISTASDLEAIGTLGFRGEALASVAAVTRTEIVTKTAEAKTGRRLVIHGGEVIENASTGCPDGTTIVVRDLFYNTPARLKFMKTDAAESGLIIDFISQIALAYKDVRFRLINNGNVLFATSGDGDRLNTIMRVYKDVDSKNMVSLRHSSNGISIEGYISSPAVSRTTRGGQIFFVNGRVINSKVIEKGVTLGYKERLFEGRYPITYLFLQVDPKDLDVNIHPNKKEIRFDKEAMVIDSVASAITEALATEDAVVDAGNIFKDGEKALTGHMVYERLFEGMGHEYAPLQREAKDKSNPFKISDRAFEKGKDSIEENINIKELLSTISNEPNLEDAPLTDAPKEPAGKSHMENLDKKSGFVPITLQEPGFKPFDFSDLKILGILFDTYIMATADEKFYLIDQHAAHERIFYEKLVGEYSSGHKEKQYIMVPIMISLPYALSEDREGWLNALEEMGFTIEDFGESTYRIPEIPMFMELGEAEDFVKGFIENIGNSTDFSNTTVINKLIMMSCKAAIKAKDILKDEEVTALISDLAKCRNPFSCPHGRPTFIKLSRYEIEKMFKRV